MRFRCFSKTKPNVWPHLARQHLAVPRDTRTTGTSMRTHVKQTKGLASFEQTALMFTQVREPGTMIGTMIRTKLKCNKEFGLDCWHSIGPYLGTQRRQL